MSSQKPGTEASQSPSLHGRDTCPGLLWVTKDSPVRFRKLPCMIRQQNQEGAALGI